MADTRPHCRALTKEGKPCGMRATLSPQGYCLNHDPTRREEKRAASQRGQRNATAARVATLRERRARLAARLERPPAPTDLESTVHFLTWVVAACAAGELTEGAARALTSACRVQLSAVEKRDLERRIRELEAKLKTLQDQKRKLAR